MILSITIPNEHANRVQDAICTRFGYDSEVDGTKAQFVKACVIKWVKEQVREHEANTAAAQAASQASASVESIPLA